MLVVGEGGEEGGPHPLDEHDGVARAMPDWENTGRISTWSNPKIIQFSIFKNMYGRIFIVVHLLKVFINFLEVFSLKTSGVN